MGNMSWAKDTLEGTKNSASTSGLAKEIASLPNATMDYDGTHGFFITTSVREEGGGQLSLL